MTHTRKLFVLATIVAASIALGAKDGITLRKTLQKGVESYHIQSTMKQTITLPGGNEQEMGFTSTTAYSYSIGDVDATAGTAPVELTTKVEKFDMEGPMADMMAGEKDKTLITTKVSGKLDSRNRFTKDPNKKVDPRAILTGSATTSIIGPLVEFPEKAVNVGDAWDVLIPKGPTTTNEDQKLVGKLVAEKEVDGKQVYVVTVGGTLKMNINVGELMKANPVPELEAMGAVDMIVTGTLQISGEANVDKATGKTISMTIKIKSNQETSVAALGDAKIPTVGTSTITVTLDK